MTIMAMVDDGLLDIDVPVSTYIDWWTTDSADVRSKVTIRHLLSHTAGFNAGGSEVEIVMGSSSQDDCTKTLYENNFESRGPGVQMRYGESGFIAAILVKVTNCLSFHFDCSFHRLQKMFTRIKTLHGARFSRSTF